MTPQSWYTSKTFWTLAVGAAFNFLRYFNVISPTVDISTAVNSVLMILGIAFRWVADQPLTTVSGMKS